MFGNNILPFTFVYFGLVVNELATRFMQELYYFYNSEMETQCTVVVTLLDASNTKPVIVSKNSDWVTWVHVAIALSGTLLIALGLAAYKIYKHRKPTLRQETEDAVTQTRDLANELVERDDITLGAKNSIQIEESEDVKKRKEAKCIEGSEDIGEVKEEYEESDFSENEDEIAQVKIVMLKEKLKDLRVAKLSTFEDKYHIEGHIRRLELLKGKERRKEMEKASECCLKNMKDKESKLGESFSRRPFLKMESHFLMDSDQFLDSELPPEMYKDTSFKQPLKFDALDKKQKKKLDEQIAFIMKNHAPHILLRCSGAPTKEEAWLCYQAFMKKWIDNYGSFYFYKKEGYEEVEKAFNKMTTSYLIITCSDEQKAIMLHLMKTVNISSVPDAWGLMKNVESEIKYRTCKDKKDSIGWQETLEKAKFDQKIETFLIHKNNPIIRKALVELMRKEPLQEPTIELAMEKYNEALRERGDVEESFGENDNEESEGEDSK